MHPCVGCVTINCGSDAKHRGPTTSRFEVAFQKGDGKFTNEDGSEH